MASVERAGGGGCDVRRQLTGRLDRRGVGGGWERRGIGGGGWSIAGHSGHRGGARVATSAVSRACGAARPPACAASAALAV